MMITKDFIQDQDFAVFGRNCELEIQWNLVDLEAKSLELFGNELLPSK